MTPMVPFFERVSIDNDEVTGDPNDYSCVRFFRIKFAIILIIVPVITSGGLFVFTIFHRKYSSVISLFANLFQSGSSPTSERVLFLE
jgi:hypothetical protein